MGPIFFLLTSWTILQILGPSQLILFAQATGFRSYIPFAIIGFSFQSVIMITTWLGLNAIRSEQQNGTVEPLFVTPSSKVAWLLGRIAGNVLLGLLSTVIVLIIGTLTFSFALQTVPDIPDALIGMLLALIGTTAFAFALAGLTFLAKSGEQINQVLWPAIVFLSGLAFPTEALPDWLQKVSWLLPITHGLTITRAAILKGQTVFDPSLLPSLLSIGILTAIYIPIGYFSFRIFYNEARKRGALGTF